MTACQATTRTSISCSRTARSKPSRTSRARCWPLPVTAPAPTFRCAPCWRSTTCRIIAMWVPRQSFIEKNRAALTDFMEDVLRQERWYLDPANHAAAVKIASELTKSPPDRWDSWLFRKDGQNGDYYHNPDGKLDLDALQTAIDTQVKLGFLKQTLDIRKFTDLSLVEEAAKRLK